VWLCAQELMNVRILKTNKEEGEVGGCSPTLGLTTYILCLDVLCAMLFVFIFLFLLL
jgi:hypothetical protein